MDAKSVRNKIAKTVKELLEYRRRSGLEFRIRNIYLGRLFSLGGKFQYELAKNLFIDSKYEVLVDCPVSYGKRQPLYPDILVLEKKNNNRVLKAIFEVKVDLGFIDADEFGFKVADNKDGYLYSRSKNEFRRHYADFFASLKFQYYVKDEYNHISEKREFMLPEKFARVVIVLMENVNNHSRLKGYMKAVNDAGFSFLSILKNKDSDIRVPSKTSSLSIREDLKNMDLEEISKAFENMLER